MKVNKNHKSFTKFTSTHMNSSSKKSHGWIESKLNCLWGIASCTLKQVHSDNSCNSEYTFLNQIIPHLLPTKGWDFSLEIPIYTQWVDMVKVLATASWAPVLPKYLRKLSYLFISNFNSNFWTKCMLWYLTELPWQDPITYILVTKRQILSHNFGFLELQVWCQATTGWR